MFGFLKKDKSKGTEDKPQELKAAVVNREELLSRAAKLENTLASQEGQGRIETLNQLGELYFQAEEYDKSIEYFEKSLSEDAGLGKAHTNLMKLYNIKRKEAAQQKDSEMTQLYLDKMDKLTNLSKDSMRKGKF